jgi:TusA-related sulfurtransferase
MMDFNDINNDGEVKSTPEVADNKEAESELDNKYDAYLKESKFSNFDYSKSKALERIEYESEFESDKDSKGSLFQEIDDKYQDYINSGKEFLYGDSSAQRDLPEAFDDLSEADKLKQTEALSKMSEKERGKYMEIAANEPAITKDASEIAARNGGELQGLEHRLKTPSSTYEKMYERDLKVEIEDMRDIIRYTEIYPSDQLADSTKGSLAEYESRGYAVDRVKNTWDDKDSCYKGINATLTSPDGQVFEVQYHTQESFDLKNDMHPQYEEWRTLADNDPRKKELSDEMMKRCETLERPENVEEVKNR